MAIAKDPDRLPCSSPEPSRQCHARPPLACLSVHSWGRVSRMEFPLRRDSADIIQSVLRGETEADTSRNQPDRISRMEEYKTIEWSQERALVLERSSNEHHPTESLLECADVDWGEIHDLLCPADNPLRSSFRIEMISTMQQFESYPRYSVSTGSQSSTMITGFQRAL